MDEPQINNSRPANPRRRKRSQGQIFKETYLPVLIGCIALLLILIFVIGAISRGIQRSKSEAQASLDASIAEAEKLAQLSQQADTLSSRASSAARHYDYEEAIRIIDSFTGDAELFPELIQKRQEYVQAMDSLVLWNDPGQILNLSFQLLIADPSRAFPDETYGISYNKNFITTEEFTKILQQLYENNYILISISDIYDGEQLKNLYLPAGKKPLILTQTQVNYYTYMTDSDGDKLPDKGGDGFASRLILDANGNLTCEMIDNTGHTVTGAYDLVPILNSFVETHPDFSFKGAKAILAVTGYDGLFGYRTNTKAKEFFSAEQYDAEVLGATKVINALRADGYQLACYTYENVPYGSYSIDQIRADLEKWRADTAPVLGDVDTLVFAKNSDITGSSAAYAGEKFTLLREFGFTTYLGFCTDGIPWFQNGAGYMRQGRILVSGTSLAHYADWFSEIFDPASVLDQNRGAVPG